MSLKLYIIYNINILFSLFILLIFENINQFKKFEKFVLLFKYEIFNIPKLYFLNNSFRIAKFLFICYNHLIKSPIQFFNFLKITQIHVHINGKICQISSWIIYKPSIDHSNKLDNILFSYKT